MAKNILEIKNLTFSFHTYGGVVKSVRDVSFNVREGEILGIVGESGCGKSVTSQCILKLNPEPPGFFEGGSIKYKGEEIITKTDREMRKIRGVEIGFIFQDPMTSLNPTMTVGKQIEEVFVGRKGMTRAEVRERALEILRLVGINEPERRYKQYPHELSGGMKQRTVIAISTILSPKVLIADEPSSALDVTSQKMVIKMMRDLMEKGFIKSMIFITHELPLLYNVTDDIMVMYAGQIVEKGTAKEMVFDPLHPYSKGLMGSIIVPEEGVREQKLTAIPGTPPNLKHPPEGCRFADRCPYAQPTCRGMKPEVIELPNGREYRCLMSERKVREVYANA